MFFSGRKEAASLKIIIFNQPIIPGSIQQPLLQASLFPPSSRPAPSIGIVN